MSAGIAGALLISLRPRQWTKNLLLFAGLVFSQSADEPAPVARAVLGFLVFCLLSGAVYLFGEFPEVEITSSTSPGRPRPSTWRAKTSSKP